MRWMIGLAFALAAAGGQAMACDYHEGFGLYAGARYEAVDPDAMLARQAAEAAARDQAMEAARNSFLSRFDIRADTTPQQSAVAADKAELKRISNVDRRPTADSQDR